MGNMMMMIIIIIIIKLPDHAIASDAPLSQALVSLSSAPEGRGADGVDAMA
jgi:hypothetical protein